MFDNYRPLPRGTHQHFAISALGFLGIPVEHRRAARHFAARFDQRLALLGGQHPGNVFASLAHQCCCLAEDAAARFDIGRAPQFETFVRRVERFIEIGGASQRHIGQCRTRRGIDDSLMIAALPYTPATTDEKREVGGVVIGHVHAFIENRERSLA